MLTRLVEVVLELTTTVAVHNTPDVRLAIETALVAAVLLATPPFPYTKVLSKFLFTLTVMVTPSLGKVDVTFTFMACVAAKAATMLE